MSKIIIIICLSAVALGLTSVSSYKLGYSRALESDAYKYYVEQNRRADYYKQHDKATEEIFSQLERQHAEQPPENVNITGDDLRRPQKK
ncbi:MAG TPA: hypothetical protein VIS99_12775 [Terrimicrobiaceae bacterium]